MAWELGFGEGGLCWSHTPPASLPPPFHPPLSWSTSSLPTECPPITVSKPLHRLGAPLPQWAALGHNVALANSRIRDTPYSLLISRSEWELLSCFSLSFQRNDISIFYTSKKNILLLKAGERRSKCTSLGLSQKEGNCVVESCALQIETPIMRANSER